MLQSINCIRMGQVLIDENLQLFILCNNCHTDLKNINDFRRHLEKCEGLERIFQDGQKLKYNTDRSTQLFGKTAKGIKEFIIYDHSDVEFSETVSDYIDLINIEEELLDPKWYSDINPEGNNAGVVQKPSKQYDVLVEEVTPFVQFKENVRSTYHTTSGKITSETGRDLKAVNSVNINTTKVNVKPAIKRRRSTIVVQNTPTLTSVTQPRRAIDLKRSSESTKTDQTYQIPMAKKFKAEDGSAANETTKPGATAPKVSQCQTSVVDTRPNLRNSAIIPIAKKTQTPFHRNTQPASEKQTAQILNKLQNLGLQVKRTHPLTAAPLEPPRKTDDKTLEILLKLQSKGMKVKVLNKQSADVHKLPSQFPSAITLNSGHHTAVKPNMAFEQNLNKNLIIRKVN